MKMTRMLCTALKRRPRLAVSALALLFASLAAGGASSRQVVDASAGVGDDLLLTRFLPGLPAGDDAPEVTLEGLGRIRLLAEDADDAAGEAEEGGAAAGPVRIRRHKVAPGESLGAIAARYGIALSTIQAANPGARVLRVGRYLEVPDRDGVMHRVEKGQTLWEIARAYKVPTAAIVEANGLGGAGAIRAGRPVFVPGARTALSLGGGSGGDGFAWPATGRLSSRYGVRKHPILGRFIFHRGLDIAAATGTPIRAARGGVVAFVGWKGGYGQTVDLRHADGTVTRYAHMSRILIRGGARVSKGQAIGRVGETGSTTGPHLHFEVRRRGRTVNPLPLLAGA